MINRRGWLAAFLLSIAVIMVLTGVKARAHAVEPLDVPCSFVRTAVRVAGGLDHAIREAIARGYSDEQIQATIRKCRLK